MGFTANSVVTLTIATTALANNPATVGMVTLTMASSVASAGGSNRYPVFNAASTPLLLSATPATKVKSTAPGSLSFTYVPQTAIAAGQTIVITPSAAMFDASEDPACSIAPTGQPTITADCTSASDSDGKVLTVTTVNDGLTADVPYTITITDELATNTATIGAGPTFKAAASAGDTTASTASTAGYRIYDAATTAEWVSGIASPLTGSASTNLTIKFYPPETVVGGATAGKVTVTASHAIFAASKTVPGDGSCLGPDCITCQSVINRYTSAVPCSATSDSTGKILTVTATTAGYDFTTAEEGQIVLNTITTNPNNGTVVFSISTGVDTTVLASQTGYQSTYVAPPAPPAPPAAAGNATGTGGTTTGTFSTATTTVTFSGYTYAAGTAATNFGNVVGCAYAKTVSDATTSLTSDMCTASAGPTFTYLTGPSTTNTVSAARRTGSNVAVALKVYHSLLSQTAAEAAVTQVGTTVATINAPSLPSMPLQALISALL